jgi:hypothetical protein
VRIGNAAAEQFQLDVYGEVMDALHQARKAGLQTEQPAWALERALMEFVEHNWDTPDEGIWEVRGSSRHFTHSKLMAWVAADRAVKAVDQFGLDGPVERWRALRDEIRGDILSKGYDEQRGTFTQYYGSKELDAAILMMPLVGFLPATDPHIRGTVAEIERELLQDGFVQRYTQQPGASVDGLAARRRGRVPRLHLLARPELCADGSPRRRPGGVRAAPRAAQRRRPARRGVRREGAAPGGQLPAGVQSCPAHGHRTQPHPAGRTHAPANPGKTGSGHSRAGTAARLSTGLERCLRARQGG